MKLYDVPNNSRIKLQSAEKGPPASINPIAGKEYTFKHCDGMYSLCYDDDGKMIHLPAWADVEVLK